MSREVHSIPPAQRSVRWGLVLSSRWPLGLAGLLMAVYGGLFALMLSYAQLGRQRDDAALDQGPLATALARVSKVHADRVPRWSGKPYERVEYGFAADGAARIGCSFVPAGTLQPGDELRVEYLPHLPQVNRAEGTRLSLLGDMVSPVLGLVVLPGLLLILLWLQGAHDLRRMLATGDVAAAEPVQVERVAWVIPVMLRARYRFRDRHARWCDGRHWVPARSPLGVRLTTEPRGLAVVHDRGHPQRSRLVVSADFGPAHGAPAATQAAPRA